MVDTENPTIEEPKKEEATEQNSPEALLEELRKLEIEEPQQLQNMAMASSQTGKAFQQVGDLKKHIEGLQKELEMARTSREPENYGDQTSVDLARLIREETKAASKATLNEYLAEQQQAQTYAMQEMSKVRSDPEYTIVGEVFEKYINSPEATMKLQTGQSTYEREYLETKAAYYRNLAKRSSKTLEGLMGKGGTTLPPHVEKGDSQTMPAPMASDEAKERFDLIKKAQKEGSINSDQALEQIVKGSLPDIDKDPNFFLP
jgi:hypothetical protein